MLTALGVFAILWRQTWLALFAVVALGAARLGLYEATADERTASTEKRDRGFLVFSRVLRIACRLVPGDPNRHPHTYIIPIVGIGIPAFMLAVTLLWAAPLYLLAHVLATGSGTWTVLAGFLGVFVYIGVAAAALKLLVWIPSLVRRARPA